ncbi:hydrogenobyrinic acid a,c-diamide synthase (glutamine-hydrolysing) /cobyrinate a,c-diamide synthase [Desulfuromusa kysingii]|uniref:Cobyrinate a,c-diamide synthase n=1 Tax=Desulfuromusa kysingii TaxID=37625 RepID=A0A1H4AIU9_9BACT|nr:cobyrinate a,c-diamide synthase [Desulfuromusa kysingii]SEA35698.1 hydrogenobyrinic acid a,c-diamide synthase (glutamine-hydrolysing) /cobyrinate a,c-diamide synthase [Desulfuromusa kysingii]
MPVSPISRARIMIAGAHSGVGKSTLTLALVAALRDRGLKVQTFKVGPDYLDPSHLAHVSGRPCFNLDGWMSDRHYVEQMFTALSADADISIIEGVMGLFDGSSSDSIHGSSAEIAAWLDVPVALVVNTHGMARSVAALVKGYNELEPAVSLAGVLANRCGSPSHAELLSSALMAADLPPLLGAIRRDSVPELPSRHLGLISAAEQALSPEMMKSLAETAEQQMDLDLLLSQAQGANPIILDQPLVETPSCGVKKQVRLAVARDEAFQFYYPDFFTLLESKGCQLVYFSPLKDEALPENIDGLYFGGGYPEVHAEALSSNTSMLQDVSSFCASDKPVYAECGGLIYLSQGVEQKERLYPFAGVLPVWAKMLNKRKVLGYVKATLQQDSLFGTCGSVFRGHEYHYSELAASPVGIDGWESVYQLQQNRTGHCRAEGYQRGNILVSYAHLHLASRPEAVNRFIEKLSCAD